MVIPVRRIILNFLITGMLIGSCTPQSVNQPDFSDYFSRRGVQGAFLIYDAEKDEFIKFCGERCQTQFIPASTFKILNAQIALETGVIKDEYEVIQWDGTDWAVETWNQDHNLRTAMQYSVVWFFEELARRIGTDRMQHYVDLVGYGNQDITGPTDIFWLEGNLRISQEEQIEFLRRLVEGGLPFSPETMKTVKEIIILEETGNYQLSGKTGWSTQVNPDIGWFVGYVEVDEDIYYFATNVDHEGSEASLGKISQEITVEILTDLEILD
jgi:beta-lactamase class D